jgi:hypothetical protein
MEQIKKIAITFHDNDFHSTFRNLLGTFMSAHNYSDGLFMTKPQIVKIINMLSYGHYLLFQNQFKYGDEKHSEYSELTEKYLTVTEDTVLINDEVDQYLSSKPNGDNYETYILTLNKENYVYSL